MTACSRAEPQPSAQQPVAKNDTQPLPEPAPREQPVNPPSNPKQPDKASDVNPPRKEQPTTPEQQQPVKGVSQEQPLKIREIATIKEENYVATCLALSPDAKTLASGGTTGKAQEVRLWDISSRKTTKTFLGHTASVTSVAFSPDGKTLGSGGYTEYNSTSKGQVFLWDVDSGERINTFQTPAPATSVAFSRDSQTFASANMAASIQLWDVNTGKSTTLKDSAALLLTFSPDGKTLASIMGTNGKDTVVKLWNVADGKNFATITLPYVLKVAFSADGKTVIAVAGVATPVSGGVGFTKSVIEQFNLDGTPKGQPISINDYGSCTFSPDGTILAINSTVRAANTSTTRLLDTSTGKEFGELGQTGSVVAFSRDGRHIATHSADAVIHVWELTGGKFGTDGQK
jgi:WD40 repeat protein